MTGYKEKKVFSTKHWDYYVNTEGFAYRININNGKKVDVIPRRELQTNRISGHPLTNKMNIPDRPTLEKLVWYVEYGYYPRGNSKKLVHVDGDADNCNIDNLRLCAQCIGSKKARRIEVIKGGKSEIYLSIGDASDALYVSYSTITRRMSGRSKKGYLADNGIVIRYVSD